MTPSEVDLTELSKGVYFVQVEYEDYKNIWKIVIQ
jgi:hypothetical protein